MNKQQIKKKKELILNIRKSVESQFNIIDESKEKFKVLMDVKFNNIYKNFNDVKQILSNEYFSKEDVLTVMRKLELVTSDIDSFIDLRGFITQDIYNTINRNNGYKKAMENYVNFLHTITPNIHLLELEYGKIQNQICELITESFNDLTDEAFSILDLKSFYDKALLDACFEAGKKNNKQNEIKEEEVVNNRHLKIYDYKEMNEFAIKNGFRQIRQTGSHLMFKKENIVVPIPQHTIGKGLSIAIQKQILNVA